MQEHRSYYVLRRQRSSDEWWRTASERTDVPPALAPLLAGRDRVELGRQEAADALRWAEAVTRDTDAAPPIVAYPDDPRRLA